MDRLHHRVLGAHTLQHGVGADSMRQLLDAGHALVTALADDVGRAKFASELLPRLVRTHRDDPLSPICLAESTPSRPTAPSPTTTTVAPGSTFAPSAANQPVPITSESARKSGSRSAGGSSGVATSVPSASGTRSSGACAPPTSSLCTHDDG